MNSTNFKTKLGKLRMNVWKEWNEVTWTNFLYFLKLGKLITVASPSSSAFNILFTAKIYTTWQYPEM